MLSVYDPVVSPAKILIFLEKSTSLTFFSFSSINTRLPVEGCSAKSVGLEI